MVRLRNTVAWRLSIWFVLLSLLPIGTMLVFVRHNVASAFSEQSAREAQVEAEVIARAAALAPSDVALREVLTAGSDGGRSVLLVGSDGATRLGSGPNAGVSLSAALPPDLTRASLAERPGWALDGDSGRVIGYAPLDDSTGSVVVIRDGGEIAAAIRTMEETSLFQLAVSLLVVAAVGGLAIWVLIGPIQRLTAAAERVGSGDLTVRLDPAEMEGELETLAVAFNGMTQRLRESYDHLEQRVADRTRELAALNEIAAVVSRSLDIESVTNAALEKTVEVLGMDVGTAFTFESETRRTRLLACHGFSRAQFEDLIRVTIDGGASATAARTGQIAVRTIDQYPPSVGRDILVGEGIQTIVGIPLVAKDRTIGACALGSRRLREITDDDRRLLSAIGQQIGVAVENALLYEAAEDAAVAAERNRLARDLHDAVTQTLFSASLIAEVLPKLWDRSPADGRRRLEELRQLTRGALAEMRSLLLELRPTVLVETPLSNLLRQLAEATTGRARLPVRVAVEFAGGERRLPPEAQVAIYRIAQESLNNTAKHAAASEATITLRQSAEATEVVIRDDGRGFDPATLSGDHLGLGIMRERARTVGVDYSLESAPGAGTTIVVRWASGATGAQIGNP